MGKLKTSLQNAFGKLQLDEMSYQVRNINEKLLSAIVSINNTEASKICLQQDGGASQFQFGSKNHMKTIATFCASFLARILYDNGFSWDDLVVSLSLISFFIYWLCLYPLHETSIQFIQSHCLN
jgi:hypothetical protein